jgi:hypothetical protein
MVTCFQPKTTLVCSSQIVHKSSTLHPQARFVTAKAVFVMFRIGLENIYSVEFWRYVVYVHGKGLRKFVSYAYFPPIIRVGLPTGPDCTKWRKRWPKHHSYTETKHAPYWWAEFWTLQLSEATSDSILQNWWQLITFINFAFSEEKLEQLHSSYRQLEMM